MSRSDNTYHVRVELDEDTDVDELLIAFRRDGELHVLAEREPPVSAEMWG